MITSHQPAYLPWLGYFAKMARADVFVVHDLSRFSKSDVLHRNKILTAAGPMWLTVPLRHASRTPDGTVNDIRPLDDGWQRRHWKSITMAYRRAPYFGAHVEFLESYYQGSYQTLTELCLPFITYCAQALGIQTPLLRSSQLRLPPFDRTTIMVELCRATGARTFLAGPHARDYLRPELLAGSGIRVEFFDFHHPRYPQRGGDFTSHLSVLDLLMHCGPGSREILLGARG